MHDPSTQMPSSDGEAFADGFRRLGLGPVIGARTWGGEIWLSSANTLSDGGVARAPMSGVYGPDGKWLIEQEGVLPDIVVENLPHATFNGQDAQLDAAIAYLQKKIAQDPRPVPKPPAYPKRAFKYPQVSGDWRAPPRRVDSLVMRVLRPRVLPSPHLCAEPPHGVTRGLSKRSVSAQELGGESFVQPQHVVQYQYLSVAARTGPDSNRRDRHRLAHPPPHSAGHQLQHYRECARFLECRENSLQCLDGLCVNVPFANQTIRRHRCTS